MEASDQAFAEVLSLEKQLNYFDPASELTQVNLRATENDVSVSPELFEVLRFGDEVARAFPKTFQLMPLCRHDSVCYVLQAEGEGGTPSVRILSPGCRFDLGGIAKGYIVDRAAECLARSTSGAHWVVNAGGDSEDDHEQSGDRTHHNEQNDERDAGFQNAFDDSHRIFCPSTRSHESPIQVGV